jgi:hypothetical protein
MSLWPGLKNHTIIKSRILSNFTFRTTKSSEYAAILTFYDAIFVRRLYEEVVKKHLRVLRTAL